MSLPVPQTGEVTFYLSLPSSTPSLEEAAAKVATPGAPQYRQFSSLDNAARQFGATDKQTCRSTAAKSIKSLGLHFAADPSRLFGRVTGSTEQWRAALGSPLSNQAATSSSPFITYSLPDHIPAALQPVGTGLLLPAAQVYDPAAEGGRPSSGKLPEPPLAAATTPTSAVQPWPFNTGTPLAANCSSPLLQDRRVYTEDQVQTAYGINTLRAHASGTPVITVLDLGGGWLSHDLKLAGQCFGYSPPKVTRTQGDGVATAIDHADDETSLDLQTVAAVAPKAQVRVVQTTPDGVLDGFSRGGGRRVAAPPTSSRCRTVAAFARRKTGACPGSPPCSTLSWPWRRSRACPRSWRRATPGRPPVGPARQGPRCPIPAVSPLRHCGRRHSAHPRTGKHPCDAPRLCGTTRNTVPMRRAAEA